VEMVRSGIKDPEDTDTFTRTELLRMRDDPADVITGAKGNGHVEASTSEPVGCTNSISSVNWDYLWASTPNPTTVATG
jgi:hypothetical protein